jgi:hypothetical protein
LRRLDYSRVGLLVLAALALAGTLAYFVAWAARASVAWLAHQPQYQVPFDQIELVNEPPGWYVGPRARPTRAQAFLEGVRSSAREPEHVSVLDVGPDGLAAVFKKYAWVGDVTRVTYDAGRIRVDLRYRQPVAWVEPRDGRPLMVDEEGNVLPPDNVDVSALDRVISKIKITAYGGLAPPVATQYGEKWKSRADDRGIEEVDERIVAAARLAGFLLRAAHESDTELHPALRIIQIIVTDFHKVVPDFGPRGLFVLNNENALIWWGDAPGSEKPGRPTAQEKWAMLRRWEQTTAARFLDTGDYWAFSRDGLQFKCSHPGARHRPKTAAERTIGVPE